MQFYSTKNHSLRVSLKEAVLNGLASDGGLYLPETLKPLHEDFIKEIHTKNLKEIAFEAGCNLLGTEISPQDLQAMIERAFNFPAPLVALGKSTYVLELFHGPTFAFKDFGARFMAQLTGHFVRQSEKSLTVLVATSGDTGSAVAHGFLGVPGINVVILYPSGKVSIMQEKQLTTLGQNISTLEVQGTFDDCQRLVKEAFQDRELNKTLRLTSANSINIARLIPQSFYYLYAYAQLPPSKDAPIMSVPSGNFGNLCGGILAAKLGMPVHHFIAATNINDTVPRYLKSGVYEAKSSRQTISNAMDVGDPSNFARLFDLFSGKRAQILNLIKGLSFSDQKTKEAIKDIKEKLNYLADPHTAVGFLGLDEYRNTSGDYRNAIVISTAHPAKFIDTLKEIIDSPIEIPAALRECLKKGKNSTVIKPTYKGLKEYLLEH